MHTEWRPVRKDRADSIGSEGRGEGDTAQDTERLAG